MKTKYVINFKKGFYLMVIMVFCFVFITLGVTMNFLVMTENGGKMPVLYDYDINLDEEHFTYQQEHEINYSYLSDKIYLRNGDIYSLGDLVMLFGVIGTIAVSCILFTRYGMFKREISHEISIN